jgi:membrane-associated phospholipid phosphatase
VLGSARRDQSTRHGRAEPTHDARSARRLLGLAFILTVALLALGWAVHAGPLPVDTAIAASVMAVYPAALTTAFDLAASLPGVGVVALLLLVAALLQRRTEFAVAVILGLGSEVPTALVKALIDRPRPPGGATVEAFGSAASYPSGHTERAVVFVGLAAIFLFGARHRLSGTVLAVVLVTLVGLARIASGEHWPLDVVGGYLLGSAWLIVAVVVGQAARQRFETSRTGG